MRWPSAAAATTCAWCGISSRPPAAPQRPRRLGQRHAGRRAAGGVLERRGAAGRAAPSRRAGAGRAGRGAAPEKSGARNGLASCAGDHRLRHDLALGGRRSGVADRLAGVLGSGSASMPAAVEHLALAASAAVGDRGVLGEQREQRGVAGGGLGQDRGDAVEPLELLGALRLGAASVSALTRARSSRTSSATTWNLVRTAGAHAAALDGGLDLAHGAGEHRDDALVVAGRARDARARGAVRVAPDWRWPRRANRPSSGLPLRAAPARCRGGVATPFGSSLRPGRRETVHPAGGPVAPEVTALHLRAQDRAGPASRR